MDASPSPAAIVAQLTQAGSPFELVEIEQDGRRFKAYRNAPQTLIELINAARVHGPKEYLSHEGDRWTFDRLFQATDALVAWMQAEAGIRPGSRVAIAMRNRPEWVVAFLASALAGAVPAPMNSFGQRDELRAALEDVEPDLLICDPQRLERLGDAENAPAAHVLLVGETCSTLAHRSWAQAVAHDPALRQVVVVQPDDPGLLLFTSGSSSRAKAVLSTQRAVGQALMNIDFIGAFSAMTSPKAIQALMAKGLSPTTLTAVPLFHVSGLHAQLLTALRNGRRLVIMPRWDAAQALELIRTEKVTQFNGAPTMVMQLMEQPGFDPTGSAASLGAVGFGGAGLPQRLIDDVTRRMPDSFSGTGFGLTETNGVGTAISGALFMGQTRSSGLPSPLMEIRVAGTDGAALPADQAGEIWLRGIAVMREYWRQPEATAQAFHDGWFRSGDVGYLNEAGFLFVIDRIKDVINRAGEKIAAAEVESCLLMHPGIAEAAVMSMPDEQTGEAVLAVVVPRPDASLTEQDVLAHVEAHLAAYKVPSRAVVRPEPLPRTATGKVVKGELKVLYA